MIHTGKLSAYLKSADSSGSWLMADMEEMGASKTPISFGI